VLTQMLSTPFHVVVYFYFIYDITQNLVTIETKSTNVLLKVLLAIVDLFLSNNLIIMKLNLHDEEHYCCSCYKTPHCIYINKGRKNWPNIHVLLQYGDCSGLHYCVKKFRESFCISRHTLHK
jgi:hypothetical protein